MPRGFEYWFGIDLNEPVDQGSDVGSNESEARTSGGHHSWQHPDEIGTHGGVKEIPEHYILPRWPLPPPDIVPPVSGGPKKS